MSPPTTGRGKKTSQAVIIQRVSLIYRLLIDGKQRAEIVRAVALAATREANERRLAGNGGGNVPPPFVWGDEGSIPDRTIDSYIQKAKKRIKEEGSNLRTLGDFILGKNFTRQDAIYEAAFSAKNYDTCRKIIRDQLQLCGLMGALKIELGGIGGGPVKVQEVPNDATIDDIAREQIELLNVARNRRGLAPLPSSMEMITLKKNGAN
jgi:hypothetical protein